MTQTTVEDDTMTTATAMRPSPAVPASKAEKRHASGEGRGLVALVSAGLGLMYAEGESAAVAAERVLGDMTPDATATARLLVVGLSTMLNTKGGVVNRMEPSPDEARQRKQREFLGRYRLQTSHNPKRMADTMERVVLVGSDGHLKMLLDFTIADVQMVRARAESKIEGEQKRVKMMATYEAMLIKYKAATGRDLPETALKRIRKDGEGAWA